MLIEIYNYLCLYIKNRKKHLKIKSPYINRNTKFGKNVIVGKNRKISYGCEIGDNTYINYNTVIDANVKVGKYCSIAPNVYIAPGNHQYSFVSTHPILYDKAWQKKLNIKSYNIKSKEKNTIIGNDVWIGVNATILQGVKIGDGAIIGANAVVTKDVENYSIVAGNPAKRIRYRFEEKDIKKLEEIEPWWNKEISNLNIENMYDIKKYIQHNHKQFIQEDR